MLQVLNVANLVNNEQGFRLKGWFKPAVTDNGVTQETFSLHVCSLAPNGQLTEEEKRQMYRDGNKFSP